MSLHTLLKTPHRWHIPGIEPMWRYVGFPNSRFYCMKCGISKAKYDAEALARSRRRG